MRHLAGSKKVLAVASAIFLVAAASGTALAMMDPGLMTLRNQQVKQNVSGQSQQSPLPTPESTSMPEPDDGVSFRGTVEVIAATGWVISGHTVQVTGDTMVEVGIDVGSLVKVHAQRQPDGALIATRIKLIQNAGGNDNSNVNGNENENEHNNGNVNSNDDQGNSNEHENENENDGHDDGNVNTNDDQHGDDHEHNSNGNLNDHNGNNHGGGDHGGDD